ncbi:heterocyst-inhibiting protein PatX [Allocoleopsis franciscana]|uniref:heterocyst-inhibiting protein PatX n=1 Tax=Allocoleopsis franciscana TaxID=2886352 RepID=UPI0036F408E4
MQIYSSILLASLLFTGLAVNSPQFGSRAGTPQPSDLDAQSFTIKQSIAQKNCPESGQSPLPGCGRRDKDMTKNS